MTDEEKAVESAEEPKEVVEQPVPAVPSGVSQEPTSQPTLDADTLVASVVEKLSPALDEMVSKKVQSTKDKRFADIDRSLAALTAAGGDAEQAKKDIMLEEVYEQLSSEPSAGTGGWSESDKAFAEAQSAQLLEGASIDFEDPEYKLLLAQYGNVITNPDQWVSVVETFVNQRKTKGAKQDITPAAAVGEMGEAAKPVDDSDLESLNAELSQLMLQPASNAVMQKRKEVREKLGAMLDGMSLTYTVPE